MSTTVPSTNEALARKLFPHFFELLDINGMLKEVLGKRIVLIGDNHIRSNEFVKEVINSNKIRVQILDFETEQHERVKEIFVAKKDALGVLEREKEREKERAQKAITAIALCRTHTLGGLDWEADSDSGEVENLDMAEYGVTATEKKHLEGEIRWAYEAMLHIKLRDNTESFVRGAGLGHHETALWVLSPELESIFKLGEDEQQTLVDKAFVWMLEELTAAEAEEENASRSHNTASLRAQSSPSSKQQSQPFAIAVLSLPKKSMVGNLPDNTPFCQHCQKFAHVDALCSALDPEEEQPNYCNLCNIEGHWEANCWRRRLGHGVKLLENRREQKRACQLCGAKGTARKWCWKLHGDNKHEHQEAQTLMFPTSLPSTASSQSPQPWTGIPRFCFRCKSSTHADKDCQVTDIEDDSQFGAEKVPAKVRSWARPAK